MDALGRFDAGLILVRADGRVFIANAVAEEILRSGHGLKSEAGILTCTDQKQKDRFLKLLKTACNPHLDTVAGGSIVLDSGKNHLFVTVFPHTGKSSFAAPLAEIVVTDPKAVLKSREQSLKTLFGLTPAEASVAMLIAKGYQPKEIAQIREKEWNTVRSQLRQVFAKTGANNQIKLMKLISQLPGEA
ncbi:MAG TPA: helix-turn-helix transcriptional regulator [Candidatus Angelobacter sp.]|nr:helix-turn-helix transcriptional regulator [Candidatus Angelobacter sp.]